MPIGVEDTVAVDVEAEDLTTRAHRINQSLKGRRKIWLVSFTR